MKPTLYLLYLDRYHQGDPLFLKELAQALRRGVAGEPPVVLLHTSGEKLERTLEAQGRFPERRDGVLVAETPEDQALAERAARESNQDLVALLTEEEVSAVGLQGADRGLLRAGDAGTVRAGGLGWVGDLVKMRVTPVVSALAEGPGRAVEVGPGQAAAALAEAFSEAFEVTFAVLAKGRLPDAEAAAPGALAGGVLPEPEVARRLAETGRPVLLTDLRRFFGEGTPEGVALRAG